MVCTKQFSLVIQTFERTYKSLITASYCSGLHNSLSFYIYIYFWSQVPVKLLHLFCLDQNVSKFNTPNVSYKPTINCILTAGNFFVFWIVFIAWRCFDMSIWFNFCASILQWHHLVHLWNSLPVSISEARTAANIKQDPLTGCRTCRGLGNTNLFVSDIWVTCDWILLVKWLNLHTSTSSTRKNRLFCSKFCLDTVNLLEECSVSKKFSALWAVLIFSNIEGSLGLAPQN